jgi:hypothetical protein
MQQVKDSPDVDTDRPVSRQLESNIYNHYAWDPYWSSGYMLGAMARPFAAPPFLSGPRPHDLAGVDPRSNEDPHLRSIEEITGYHIHATDGEIGHVEDFLVDDAGWGIRYVAVDTRNWWPGKKVLILPLLGYLEYPKLAGGPFLNGGNRSKQGDNGPSRSSPSCP